MGFLADGLSVGPGGLSRPAHHRRRSSRSLHKSRRSRSRSPSPSRLRSRSSSPRSNRRRRPGLAASFFAADGPAHHHHAHDASRASFFGLGNSSRSSLWGLGSSSRPSYYRRSPRHGFLQRAYRQLRRLLRDLVHYAKRHPWKVFFLVVMPLVTGGALTALLARFGLRMPPSLERMLGLASRAAAGDALGLVSDAVRVAAPASDRARHGPDLRSVYASPPRDGAWGESIVGVAKMFL